MKSPLAVRTLGLAALCLLMQGCVLSLHPLFTKETITFKEELLGTWTENGTTWKFQKDDSDHYLVTLLEKDDEVGSFDGVLVKIDGKLFLDLYPKGPDDWKGAAYWKFHFLKAHTFLHVQEIGPKLKMRAMNPNWMTTYLEENPEAVQATVQDDRPILTAPTADLQKLIAKLADMKPDDEKKGPFGPATDLVKKD